MSTISTHVLDTSVGQPAKNVRVRLFSGETEIGSGVTNADGRCATLLDKGTDLTTGVYRIVFEIADRFPDGFYPEVSITFAVRDSSAHYHVPLLISPFGFTTYRGS
ncbi:MAG: hydroxyisourate hydrolase [Bryobacteraceae bacterium]